MPNLLANPNSLRPSSSSKPFLNRHVCVVRDEDRYCACLWRYRINCFTARLLSVVGYRTCVDSCWMATCMSGLQSSHEDEFSDACAEVGVVMTIQRNCCRELHHCGASTWIGSRFLVFQHGKIQKGCHAVCTVCHLEAPACHGDLTASKRLTVPPALRNTTTSVKYKIQTGLHVFKIAHEMFFWSRAHHVIHVTQEVRII